MEHVVAFSGGKDSTALLLWMREQARPYTAVFCDTGWEHPLTYAYIEEINRTVLDGQLVTVRSTAYADMEDLVMRKGRVPSMRARFCTQELKVKPMIAWLQARPDEVTLYQGIRAEESPSRATLPMRQYDDGYDCWIERPLLHWTAAQCFEILHRHGIAENPLYRMGAGRVGCFPCILVNHGDLKRMTLTMPELWDRIVTLEQRAGRSFFYPKFIPARFHTGWDPKSGKSFPTAMDVRQYRAQATDAELARYGGSAPACMSVYNLCE
mgnify:FL=1